MALSKTDYADFFADTISDIRKFYPGAVVTIWRDEIDASFIRVDLPSENTILDDSLTVLLSNSDEGLIEQGDGWTAALFVNNDLSDIDPIIIHRTHGIASVTVAQAIMKYVVVGK